MKVKPDFSLVMDHENVPKNFDIVLSCCENEGCTCTDIHLIFFEDEKAFELIIDYKTWEINSFNVYKDNENYSEVISYFMDNLGDDLKKDILTRIHRIKTKNDLLKNDIDYSIYKKSFMVCYNEIYDNVYGDFSIEYENIFYYVFDNYCPNQECKCNSVMLIFIRLENQVLAKEPDLLISLYLDSKKFEIEKKENHISKQQAEQMYNLFIDSLGSDAIDLFKKRYIRMKEWGRDYLSEELNKRSAVVRNTPKVGRNDPCPCGSGKKYKKCCAQ